MAFQSDTLSEKWISSPDDIAMFIPTSMKGWVVHPSSRGLLRQKEDYIQSYQEKTVRNERALL